MEIHQQLSEALRPALEQQRRIEELTKSATSAMTKFEIANPAIEITKQMQFALPLARMAEQFACYQVNPGIATALDRMSQSVINSISASVQNITAGLSDALLNAVQSPFVDWLSTFDYSPFKRIFEELQINIEPSEKFGKLNKAYLQAMYDCEWFPYAGWIADVSLFQEVNEILATSRGKSKRRTARIDKAILAYYTPKEIRKIKQNWRDSDLKPHIKKMLCQAINAHLRAEYALTIVCLATMWEGLIHYKTNVIERRQSKKTKEDFKVLISENDFDPVFAEYYEKLIVSQVNSDEEVKDGVPNRNGVSHSKYKKYPNKKASLNAILLTDFIIGLTPKVLSEEKENG